MSYKNGNYTAFYVSEPFDESNLGANATKDFVYYNLLKAWKAKDSNFPFIDSHDKNYNVRDNSDWEKTLKPRIRDRLNQSKNIILFLSTNTKNSIALKEEMEYGIGEKKLPVIVVYAEQKEKKDIIDCESKTIKPSIKKLWDNLPSFRDQIGQVPTIHIPNSKILIQKSLNDPDLMYSTKISGRYFYPC